jgi:hypothetical protein
MIVTQGLIKTPLGRRSSLDVAEVPLAVEGRGVTGPDQTSSHLPNANLFARAKNVRLLRCLSTQLRGHRSGESDSQKTFEFSARKSCVKKRMRIRDEARGGSRQTVD